MNVRIVFAATIAVATTLSLQPRAHAQTATGPSQPTQIIVASAQVGFDNPTTSDLNSIAAILPDSTYIWTSNSGSGGGKSLSVHATDGQKKKIKED